MLEASGSGFVWASRPAGYGFLSQGQGLSTIDDRNPA